MATGKDLSVNIPAPNFQMVQVSIKGTAPIIFNQWSEKAKQMILDKQMMKANKGREAKNPEEDYEASFYRLSDGRIGFPALGVKQAMVAAARNIQGVTMALLKGAIWVQPEDITTGLIPLTYDEENRRMRQDMVRIAMGTADIRIRGEITDWEMTFVIKFNADVISVEQVINLLNIAGFACGLGEWRPEKSGGDKGTFEVVEDAPQVEKVAPKKSKK